MNNKPKYSLREYNDKRVVIRDEFDPSNPTMSVTNGAEIVVKELYREGWLQDQQLLYFDTEGQLDELVHDNKGNFKGFKPYGGSL